MKKLCTLLISICLMLGCVTGCSTNNNHGLNPDKPVTIKVWHYYNGQQLVAFEKLVKNFNKTEGKEKGIIVEVSSKSSIGGLYSSLLASVNKEVGAETMPDIFGTYADFAYQLDEKKVLASLNDYFDQDELDSYIKGYLDDGYFASKTDLKLLPTAKATEIMIVNDTDFQTFAEACDVEYDDLESIDGLIEVSKKYYEYTDALTPEKNDGKAFFGRDSLSNYLFLGAKQLGDDIYTVNSKGTAKITLKKETAKTLWDSYYVPFISGYFAANGRYRSDDAKTGDILAFVGSSTGATYFPSQIVDANGGSHDIAAKTIASPKFDDGEDYAVQQGADMAVSKSDETHEYASCLFLKWMTSVEQNVDFTVSSAYLPVKKEVNSYKDIKKHISKDTKIDKNTKDALEVSLETISDNKLYSAPAFSKSNNIRDIVSKSLEEICSENRTKVKEALNTKSLDEAISEYNTQDIFENWYNTLIKDLNSNI